MKKHVLALILTVCMTVVASIAMAGVDVAISSQAGWFGQAAADREMAALQTAIKGAVKSVVIYPADKQADLATWVKNNTSDGENDMLILCGQCPNTIYKPGNTQADDSLIELYLDAGNTILNTGDYFMYVVDGAGTNEAGGIQTLMDIADITMWDDDTAVKVTADGKQYCPSLKDFATDRPFHLDQLKDPWKPKIILAQNTAGTRADPVLVGNTKTGGMVGIFYQTASQDDDPRAKVMGEFINSYFLLTAVEPASKLTTSWGAIKK